MKLPDENKGFGERLAVLLGKVGIKTNREALRRAGIRFLVVAIVAAASAGVMIPGLFGKQYPVSDTLLGTYASTNYKSDRDYQITDQPTTERLRQDAVAETPSVLDLDARIGQETGDKISRAFAHLHKVALMAEAPDGGLLEEAGENSGAGTVADGFARRVTRERENFEKLLQIPIESEVFDALISASLDKGLGPILAKAVADRLSKGVVADRALLLAEGHKRFSVRDLSDTSKLEHLLEVESLRDLQEAKTELEIVLNTQLADRSAGVREAAIRIATSAMQPTLIHNRLVTEERRQMASVSVKPVTIKVRRGEMILRDGDPFQARHLQIFRGIQEEQRSRRLVTFGFGVALIVALLITALFIFSRRSLRQLRLEEKDLIALSIVLISTVALATVWNNTAPALQERFPQLPLEALREIAPIAFGPMLVGFLFSAEVALAFCMVGALLAGVAMESSLSFAIYAFAGGLAASTGVARARQRTTLLKAGVLTGVVSAAAGVFLMMASGKILSGGDIIAHVAFGILSGLTSAVLVAGVVPVIEAVFGYVSDIKLLELANLNHPLLKDLIVQAPGTYHHSIIIGSLVEAGAEVIGANPLLTRVMAYYHDVGKMKNPRYFAENQRDGNNPHHKLAPSMSSLILRAHVKDGLEMANRHNIPPVVSNAIVEHHGNNLMTYFYNKAKQAEDAEVQTVNEVDYRYGGRRPRSRETALVMIADVVEAASRSVAEPTSDRLMGLVQKTINRLFADGSLNESDLTLRDLNEIAKAFHRILLGIYHERPAYQNSATKERRADTKEIPKDRRGADRRSDSQETHRDKKGGDKDNHKRESRKRSESGKRKGEESAAANGRDGSKNKEAARADGDRQGNGKKQTGGGDRSRREEPPEENLKRLGSERQG